MLTCDSSHRYHLDGREIPGCTRVIDTAGISDYSVIREDILERASEIGKLTHTACEYFDDGGVDWNSIPEAVKPRVEAWAKFTSTEAFTPGRIEHQIAASVHGMAYGMRVDRAGLMRGKPAIVEIKTTAQIMPQHGIQLAGYGLGLKHEGETEDIGPLARFLKWERYVVQLRADGTFRLQRFKDLQDANIFTSALAITWWKMSHGHKIRNLDGE